MRKILCLLSFTAFLFCACSKSLEEEPLQNFTNDVIFDERDSLGEFAINFLTDVYTYLPIGYNRISNDVLDAASDDAISSQPSSFIQAFTNGQISPFNLPDDAWQRNYTGIRKANVFLANFDRVPLKATQLKVYYKAEARFLRAIFYFELIKRYGGVPLLRDRVLTLDEDIAIPKSSFDDCANYVLAECDSVTNLLRPDLPSSTGSDVGRITKSVPLALKARLLLYMASPLNNPSGDAAKWTAAANAAKVIMSSNIFTLTPSFSNLFLTRSTSEVILAYQRTNNTEVENANAPVGYSINGPVSNGYTSPTQNLVNAFGMANGRAITETGSGYNPASPYAGRDPRLALTVFYNGLAWLGRPVETFEGGRDKLNAGTARQTRTGYYMRKFLGNFPTGNSYSGQTHNFIIFRYGEVLLNFAEAQNEAVGPTTEVYAALDLIRKRAGLVPSALPAGLSKDGMRAAIRNERRVEMAFEEQRFWDIRRWKIAETVLNGKLKGVTITKNATTGALSFQEVDALTVSFDPAKMYLYPIPFTEINRNRNLVQNPGW